MLSFRALSRSFPAQRPPWIKSQYRAYGFQALHRPTKPTFRTTPYTGKPHVRHASTETTIVSRLSNLFYGTTLILGLGIFYFYFTDTRASAHRWVIVPALRIIYRDPEEAHHAGNKALKALYDFNLHPRERVDKDAAGDLAVEVFGHTIRNPIATSAGIDKHAEIPDALFAMGPAIIEIGGATPQPQPGNDKPRVFRLTSQNAFINRYGLNSEGADHIAMRLRRRVRAFAHRLGIGHDEVAEKLVLDGEVGVPPGSLTPGKLLAVNIAKNKNTPGDDIRAVTKDYVYCVERLGPYADILVVNVSSPNTPGLRNLQKGDSLKQILRGVVAAAKSVDRATKPAVMVKVSPDEDSDSQIAGICEAVWSSGVDGVIVGNTTNQRPEALSHLQNLSSIEQQYLLEQGGFSGPHLFERTKALTKRYKQLLTSKPDGLQQSPSSRDALEAEASRLKASIEASTGLQQPVQPDTVSTSVHSGVVPPRNISQKPEVDKKPLINIPSDKFYDQSKAKQDSLEISGEQSEATSVTSTERGRLQSILGALDQLPAKEEPKSLDKPKVIFSTGGITNGRQAREVLDAGADVAMIYTALVYGGVGTICRIKDELRDAINKR